MLKDLKCPACKSSSNLLIFIDFKKKKPEVAICLKIYFKPSLIRKHGPKILKSNGCGYKFNLKASGSISNSDPIPNPTPASETAV